MSVDQFLLSADTTDLNYPEIRPTLDLNFARVKALDPRITFTRASGGSYVGADGLIKYAGVNEARFDHDPVTGESLGLLIEESRTNLFLRSEEFNEGSWTKTNTSATTNAIAAPNGTLTAEKIVATTTNAQHFILQGTSANINPAPITVSIYAKAAEYTSFLLRVVENTTFLRTSLVSFNLSNGTAGTPSTSGGATAASASIVYVGDGWYRCALIVTLGGSELGCLLQAFVNNAGNFAGNDVNGIYLWGAQLEQGAFPTSYIPTQGSTRTRARDTASIVGKNFSDFYNQIDSALFFSGRTVGTPNVAKLFGGVVDTSKGFVSSLYFNVGSSPVVVAWSPLTSGDLGAYVSNTLVKGILTYTSSQPTASFCRDGRAVVSNFNRSFSFGGVTQFGFPNTMNRLVIGSSPWGFDSVLNGTINRLTYWPKRLPNAQLQALTR